MTNRLREFQNFGLVSSIPQGLVDPEEMAEQANTQGFEDHLDEVIEALGAQADEYKAKLGLWPNDAHESPMYLQYLARVVGSRIVIEDLFDLKCTMRDARKN